MQRPPTSPIYLVNYLNAASEERIVLSCSLLKQFHSHSVVVFVVLDYTFLKFANVFVYNNCAKMPPS